MTAIASNISRGAINPFTKVERPEGFEAVPNQNSDGYTKEQRPEVYALPATMFAGRNRTMSIDAPDGDISINFDMLISEGHGWNVRASTHPVQQDSPFTDHTELQIQKGNIVGYITNFGLKRGELVSNVAQDTFDILEEYKLKVVPVTIVTSLKMYENYIITSCKVKRDGKTGEAQGFNLSFQEFRIVQLKEVGIEASQVKRPDETALKTDANAQQVSPNANVGEQKGLKVFFSDAQYNNVVGVSNVGL